MKLRSYITATPGNILIQVDLSQAESWIVAFCANEPNMKNSLQNSDIHKDTASAFFNKPTDQISKLERYTAKRCNHAFAYRMSPIRFVQVYNKDAVDNGIPEISIKEATRYRNKWLETYQLEQWWAEIERELSEKRVLVNLYGRLRTFFGSWGMELFKEGTAHIPQSTIADHFLGAVHPELGIEGGLKCIVRDWKDCIPVGEQSSQVNCLKGTCKIINFSHDSCIADIHPSMKDDYVASCLKYIRRPLISPTGEMFTIPADVEIGERWGEMEKVNI